MKSNDCFYFNNEFSNQFVKRDINKNYLKSLKFQERGVTMLSLVVTIVVLLILSGITIKFALSDNGIIKQSRLASEKYKNSAIQEQVALNEALKEMNVAFSNEVDSGSSSEDKDDLIQQIEILQDQVNSLNGQIDDLKAKQATGNATPSQVLSGSTFSTSTGIGLTGTMKNNGGWSLSSSGNGKVTIPAGYHNGSGYIDLSGSYNDGFTNGERVYSKKYLYNAGDECTSLTGGWVIYPFTYSLCEDVKTFTKANDYMRLETNRENPQTIASIGPSKKVNLTGVDTITVDFIETESGYNLNGTCELRLFPTIGSSDIYSNPFNNSKEAMPKTRSNNGQISNGSTDTTLHRKTTTCLTADVSNLDGEYYLIIFAYYGSKPNIYDVWMK